MHALDHARYLALREGAHVLEADGTGDKVLRLSDGSMLKLFRRKRLISSAAWYPYARRFADNCQALAERGIPCPQVKAVYRIAEIARDAVHYDPLPGHTLRQLLEQPGNHPGLRDQLGRFIAALHEAGVYFRSAHLGNVVLTPEGKLGLIDVADLRMYRKPLRRSQRQRNFRHMLRYREDRAWLLGDGDNAFIEAYLASQQVCRRQDLANALA
ncbi:phosphotransferase [Pseudomonas mosselii]|uniref:phosphotransferase n=1 Tax=unclassified Pseudomonas TaxID=196821 RepID=UPI001F40AB3B|nr:MULTISPECIES: phosphotransferase [unclassified Pseudomonas]MCF1490017.1 phosphotransferase [Pseudomonas sp. AA27]MCP8633176.1 phosphotransferase [Pseudomonas sp. DVZ6]MDD7786392.1 phosphotransferase [Pseudomonas sp. DVZ24]